MTRATWLVIALMLVVVRAGEAQKRSALEARVDGIVASRVTTLHLGIGGTRVLARNLEVQVVIGGGTAFRDGSSDRAAAGRADLLARFAPLPANGQRWSAYVAGGISTLVERGTSGRAVLALLVGMEGGRARETRSFVELGVGGGLRVGAGVRF
jgi:hypothetical protein